MGDSSAMVKDSQKRKRIESSSNNNTQNNKGDVLLNLPTILPCSSSTNTSWTKKLCFWGKGNLDGNFNFFVVDVCIDKQNNKLTKKIKELAVFDHRLLHTHTTNQEKEHSVLTPIFCFPRENSTVPLVFNSFATLGTLIYSIGGILSFTKDKREKYYGTLGSNLVHYFDTSTHGDKNNCHWKQGPPMLAHRRNPQVFTTNCKIFVFGCFGEKKCRHKPSCVWAESFHSSTGEWTPLTVPEFKRSLIVCSTSHTKKNHATKKLYALIDDETFHEYDIETNCWTYMASSPECLCGINGQLAMINKVFYWFKNEIHAYGILSERKFEGPVQDFSFQRAMRKPVRKLIRYVNSDGEEDSDNPRRYYSSDDEDDMRDVTPAVFHLGGRYFCLLAFLHDLEEDNPRRVHCLIIKVSKTNEYYKLHYGERRDIDKFFLGAHVVSCQSFPIDRELESIDGRVMMI